MTDSAPNLYIQLMSAISVLNPQIEGLNVLSNAPLSAFQAIVKQLSDRQRRRDLIANVGAALDALSIDGYPASPPVVDLTQPLISGIRKKRASIESAINIFMTGS